MGLNRLINKFKQPGGLSALIGQTFIYGLSSIIGRVINFLFVPLYTRLFLPETYAVVTLLYAYISFFNILFSYGLETAFFRFFNKQTDKEQVLQTSLFSIFSSTLLLCLLLFSFSSPLAALLGIGDHPEYIRYCILILGLDALAALPFAWLRQCKKAIKFVSVRLANIMLNVFFNGFFLLLCPAILKHPALNYLRPVTDWLYQPGIGVGYVFISNFLASLITLGLLWREWSVFHFRFDFSLWKQMMTYAWPILIAGFAGMINETMDRILLVWWLPGTESLKLHQIGIYGACYKLAMLMTLFIHAFRMAAEPFFFEISNQANARRQYSRIMNYFVLAGCVAFLAIMLYMEKIKILIGLPYHEGLNIVPILLLANLALGIYYNLTIWYKLTDKTIWGAYITLFGALITLTANFMMIPKIGYLGAAIATLICYALMAIVSFFLGQHYYRIPYQPVKILLFIGLALLFYFLNNLLWQSVPQISTLLRLTIKTASIILFTALCLLAEKKWRDPKIAISQ